MPEHARKNTYHSVLEFAGRRGLYFENSCSEVRDEFGGGAIASVDVSDAYVYR